MRDEGMKQNLLVFALLLSLIWLVGGCGSGEEAAAAAGTTNPNQEPLDEDDDGEIDNVPDGVNDLFTPELLESFRNAGLPIYTGLEPPTAAGSFYADTLQITYDDLDQELALVPYMFTFVNQTASGAIRVSYDCDAGDSSTDNPAFIAGEGMCFSVFADIAGYSIPDNCNYAQLVIYSACFAADGNLNEFGFGISLSSTSGDCAGTLPAGHHRIITEIDGYCPRVL
jgi:hypothetical protein